MDLKETILQRRAVNFFDPNRDVTDEKLKTIVEVASRTPSSLNLQPWNLMIIRVSRSVEGISSEEVKGYRHNDGQR